MIPKTPHQSDGTLDDMRHQILKLAAANSCRPKDIEMYHGKNCSISNGFLIWAKFHGVKVREREMVTEGEAVLIKRQNFFEREDLEVQKAPWPGAGFFMGQL